MGATRKTAIGGNRTFWGGGRVALWVGSIVIGVVLATILGTVVWFNALGDPKRLVAATVSAAFGFAFGFPMGWFVLVDLKSVRGAAKRPGDTIENQWSIKAMQWGFIAFALATGILMYAATFNYGPMTKEWVVGGLAVIYLAGFGVWGLGTLFLWLRERRR